MSINGISNNPMAIMPMKTTFTAKNVNEGTPLGTVEANGKYDTVELSLNAKEAYNNAKPLEISHQEIAKADLSHLEGKWVVTIYADGRIDDPIADYNRSQGNYFGDVWSAAMGMPSGKDIYQDAIASGMSKEQAWEQQRQITTEHFRNNLDEALAIATKLSPNNTDADGQPIEYSDVYDKNGELKIPAKVTISEYQKNLQSIIDNMMITLQSNQSKYPNLYKTHFGD